MQSLKDKLLKAGLVTEDQAKKAEAEKATRPPARAPAPRAPSSSPRRFEQPRDEAPIPKLPPLANSKAANRLMAKQQLELDRKIREKVLAAEVAVEVGATTFHFVTRKGKLRRLELSEAQHQKLEAGELAVVERPDPDQISHALVPAAVAMELKALSERSVRFLNKDGVQIGFSEDAPAQDGGDAPASADAPAAAAAPAEEKPADGETWLTVRRAKT